MLAVYSIRAAALVAGVFASLHLLAQPEKNALVLGVGTGKIAAGRYTWFLKDSTNKLSIADVLTDSVNHKFQRGNKDILAFGLSPATYWLKLPVKADVWAGAQPWVIELTLASYNQVSFFYRDTRGQWVEQKTGTELPFASRPINYRFFAFSLPVQADHLQHVYLRIKTQRAYTLPLVVYPQQEFVSKVIREEWLYGAFLGILTFVGLFNLLLFFNFRQTSYIYCGIYVSLSVLLLAVYNGYLFQFFLPTVALNPNELFFYTTTLQRMFVIIFAMSFLQINRTSGFLYYFLVANLMLFPLLALIRPWLAPSIFIHLQLWVSLFTLGLTTFTGVYFLLKGRVQVRFYAIGYLSYFIGLLGNTMLFYTLVDANFFTVHGGEVGIFLDAIFLTLALGDKYRIERNETQQARDRAQQELLDVQRQATVALEARVAERTTQLQTMNSELLHLNAALTQQRETVQTLNRDLESRVTRRTEELNATVNSLVKQNEDLEQFSYIVSHNLRAPVARILGLAEVYRLQQDPEILGHLTKAAHALDELIRDLTQIVSIRENFDTNRERVDLEAIVQSELAHVQEYLKKINPVLVVKMDVKQITSVKIYVQSIFHNLISNAIKYRDPARQLQLIITAEHKQGGVCIQVTDNGLGMPAQDPYKIFGLYQRLHNHVEGKGLGLYLVKTQVDAMQGKIEVQSSLGAGSSFRVWLPMAEPN